MRPREIKLVVVVVTARCSSSQSPHFTLAHHRVPVAQWLEHPFQNTEGRGFKSHLELGFFSELDAIYILVNIFVVVVVEIISSHSVKRQQSSSVSGTVLMVHTYWSCI